MMTIRDGRQYIFIGRIKTSGVSSIFMCWFWVAQDHEISPSGKARVSLEEDDSLFVNDRFPPRAIIRSWLIGDS